MANFKTDVIVTKEQADISNKAEPSNYVGKLPLFALASYTLLGTEAASDTIQICDIPAECVVIPQLCSVSSLDPGTTLTLNVGDAADVDRYAAGIVLSAGGQVGFGSGTQPDAVPNPYLPTTQLRIYATVASAATLSAGVKLNFLIAYRIKG